MGGAPFGISGVKLRQFDQSRMAVAPLRGLSGLTSR